MYTLIYVTTLTPTLTLTLNPIPNPNIHRNPTLTLTLALEQNKFIQATRISLVGLYIQIWLNYN